MSANRRLILKIGAVLERFIIFFHLLLYRKGLDFQHRRSLSAYLKQPPLEKIRLNTMRQDLAKSPGQGPGPGAVKGYDTPEKVFLPGIPTDSWPVR